MFIRLCAHNLCLYLPYAQNLSFVEVPDVTDMMSCLKELSNLFSTPADRVVKVRTTSCYSMFQFNIFIMLFKLLLRSSL